MGPDHRKAYGDQADGKRKPQQIHTAAKGHADKDEHENQGNPQIFGQGHIQSEQQRQMEQHMKN